MLCTIRKLEHPILIAQKQISSFSEVYHLKSRILYDLGGNLENIGDILK